MKTHDDDFRKAAVFASFLGDAHALTAHWIYDTAKIGALLSPLHGLEAPKAEAAGYHPGREAGSFTHYGDQTLVLLQSIAAKSAYDPDDFATRWRALWEGYTGYVDKATRETLANLKGGASPWNAASPSTEMAGASRISPLLLAPELREEEALARAARRQTALTHGDPIVADAAEFFARVTHRVLAGGNLRETLAAVAAHPYPHLPATAWLAEAEDTLGLSPSAAIADLGQACSIADAFPATLYLLLKFPCDLAGALKANTMAGGDSAARGLVVGMVLGAANGMGAIPLVWLEKLRSRDEVERACAIFL